MSQPAHKTEGVNRIQNMRFYPFVFLPERMRTACDRSGANGKERDILRLNPQSGGLCGARLTSPQDLLTGYGYLPRQARQAHHGARYMDHELMTLWLSVDPMSDKYPSISPYAYCAWNPVRLVDPDGKEVVLNDDIVIKGANNSSITIKTDAVNWTISTSNDFGGNYTITDLTHVAIGYEKGVCGEASAVTGTTFSGYVQSVMFLGGDFAGYWYDYIGGEALVHMSNSIAATVGVSVNRFVAIHDSEYGMPTPSSFILDIYS